MKSLKTSFGVKKLMVVYGMFNQVCKQKENSKKEPIQAHVTDGRMA